MLDSEGVGVDSGGETEFPLLSLKVRPEAGMAIVWSNLDENGQCDPLTEHASVPLKSGDVHISSLNKYWKLKLLSQI